jgi:hypothetical protein
MLKIVTSFLWLLPSAIVVSGFIVPAGRLSTRHSAIGSPLFVAPSVEAISLKKDLLESLQDLREKQARDGEFSIDFGVKGGELNQTSRAPQKVSYYAISDDVGQAADKVMSVCDQLAEVSPIDEPTKYLGDKVNGTLAPLNGAWKLMFTTAADASFSKNSSRGDAKVQNVVDGARGRITNVIDFANKADGSEPVLKQLNVVIKAVADGPKRVELTFRYARAVLNKFFFIPIRWSLYIPVPGPFITQCIVLFYRIFTFGRKSAKKPPKAFFDVVYLDDDLRIHKTGEDNLFVQARESWEDARKYIE